MKILIFGSGGFVGRNVAEGLGDEHQIFLSRQTTSTDAGRNYPVDLTSQAAITQLLKDLKPQVIINCAGIVDKNGNVSLNALFSQNIFEAVLSSRLNPRRIVICGSASEYGQVTAADLPIKEKTPLKPINKYGQSKVKETSIALEYRQLPITVARIFNPLGPKMNPQMFIPRLLKQIASVKKKTATQIEVLRLDSKRDYIDIKDVAAAIKQLAENTPNYDVYNIGSGISTSNATIVQLLLDDCGLTGTPVIETMDKPEPMVATQADISRLAEEFNWRPTIKIEETMERIVDDAR